MDLSLRDTPIRRKLMLIILLISGAASVMTCAILFTYEFYTYRRTTVQQLSTLGEIVAANSTAALTFENQDDAKEILNALKAERHVVAACLYDRKNQLFAHYPADADVNAFPATPGAQGYHFTHADLAGFQPVALGDRRIGALYLRYDMGVLYARLRLYGGMIVLVMAVSFLLAYVLSAVLQTRITRPILALAKTAGEISRRRDYSVRAALYGRDEVGMLAEEFNRMIEQIERLNAELEQRVIQRTAQLEEANKELEAFSYSVSHDLRAPLRHIDGFAQLLDKHAGGALDEKGRRYLDTIADSAKRLGTLIDELLVFSRMGRAEMRQASIDTRAMVDEILRELQPELQGRQIEWRIGEMPEVRADPVMLRQVWINLLSNAAKYTRRRPAALVEVTHQTNGTGEHVFSIRDNGAGFDMKYVHKLFGVFQRLHTTQEFEGTGIGLANVRRIVLRHGGRTWAEGCVGEGATFHFSLPASS